MRDPLCRKIVARHGTHLPVSKHLHLPTVFVALLLLVSAAWRGAKSARRKGREGHRHNKKTSPYSVCVPIMLGADPSGYCYCL